MIKQFTATVQPEDNHWIAQCLEVDVASQKQKESPGQPQRSFGAAL